MAKFYIDGGAAEFSDDDLSKLRFAANRLHLSPAEMADWLEDAASASTTVEVPLSAGEHTFIAESSGLDDDANTEHVETAAQQQARLLRTSFTAEDVANRLGVDAKTIRERLAKEQLWSFVIADQHRLPIWQFVSASGRQPGDVFTRPKGRRRASNPEPVDLFLPIGVSSDGWGPLARFNHTWEELDQASGPFFLRISIRDADGNVLRELEHSPVIADSWTTLPGLEQVVPAIPEGTTPVSLEGFMTSPQDELLVGGNPWSPRRWLVEGQDPVPVAQLVADLGTVW